MLIADGWIEYPYAQTMFGAWQAAAAYVAPSIDARDGEGRWRTILEQFGYPAGMPRQMSVPLAGLPALVTAIRLRTNQEVYWDRLAVAWSEPCPNAVITRLPLVEADLTRSGFALRTTGPQRQPRYNQSGRSPTWDTRHQSGHYSALGEVTELVTRADGGMAIFGPGEEVTLSFAMPPTAPPLEPGWTRRFVLEAHGWCKDMDLYTRDGETIDPLPVSPLATEAGSLLNRRYNTRYESGR